MKKLLLIFFLFSYTCQQAWATHIRAGDLTMFRVQTADPSLLSYRIILDLYRDSESDIQFDGSLDFGDGVVIPAISDFAVNLGTIAANVEHWRVEVQHTFPSDGVYQISYFEQNRNSGIRNMSNSVDTPFFIESTFLINQELGLNNSPQLTVPPIDEAVIGQRFTHNPGAFDQQGDSLAYKLTICKRANNTNVDNYSFPDNPNFSQEKEDGSTPPIFSIDPITGDLVWDAPAVPGEYNVAFYVEEWRDGLLIGLVNRDMQITVRDHNNLRPEVIVPLDTCIVATNLLIDTIKGLDPDGNIVVKLTTQDGGIQGGTGQKNGLFALRPPSNPATFSIIDTTSTGVTVGLFQWQTTCFDVQEQPYEVIFKAEDNRPASIRLADIKSWRIKVVGPAPENLTATADQAASSITLDWDAYSCLNAEKMTIWRRINPLDIAIDTCVTGVNGYVQVGEVDINTTTFTDANLERGLNYCYRVYAVYPAPKGGKSLVSNEACQFIESIAPYMLNVSIDSLDGTSETNGKILVRWSRGNPEDASFPPPYTYTLQRAEGQNGTTFTVVATDLTDTTYRFDEGLNTEALAYNYRVSISSQGTVIDTSSTASSVRLVANPKPAAITLSWTAEVPWNNTDSRFPYHYIYRKNPSNSAIFELIDSVNILNTGFTYTDDGSFNGQPLLETEEYCYYVSTIGGYDQNVLVDEPLRNHSQKACAFVQDSIPPCPPVLSIAPVDCAPLQRPLADQTLACDNIVYSNQLSWVLGAEVDCDNQDIIFFRLYYSATGTENLTLLEDGLTDLSYIHSGLLSVAGCYAVTAVDDFGNESDFSNIACIEENCPYYELPNIFTPNNDGHNDTFVPFRCPRFVEKVIFKAYNRWGALVYESDNNIEIQWDGNSNSGKALPSGAYYYIAEVTFYNLSEKGETITLNGIVNLLRE